MLRAALAATWVSLASNTKHFTYAVNGHLPKQPALCTNESIFACANLPEKPIQKRTCKPIWNH